MKTENVEFNKFNKNSTNVQHRPIIDDMKLERDVLIHAYISFIVRPDLAFPVWNRLIWSIYSTDIQQNWISVQQNISLACSGNIDQTPSRMRKKIAHPSKPSMNRRFNATISPKMSLGRPRTPPVFVESIQQHSTHFSTEIQQIQQCWIDCWICWIHCFLSFNKHSTKYSTQFQQFNRFNTCWMCWIVCWMHSTQNENEPGRRRDNFGEIGALNLRIMDGSKGCAILFGNRDGVWSMLLLHARLKLCWTQINILLKIDR